MADVQPRVIHLADYAPPVFLVDTVDLDVDISSGGTRVRTRLGVRRNPGSSDRSGPLVLDGDGLTLDALSIDGRAVDPGASLASADRLVLQGIGDRATVEIENRIDPDGNSKLMGLYRSRDGYFTQCEAEGFRRITWFPDRPDVMSRYSTTIHADRDAFPVLLSNGNRAAAGEEPGGRHWVRWEDPFPKPCYLFALVAAKLDRLGDRFVTRSGREVELSVYVEPGKLDQAGFAMEALRKSMRWDEEVFGLELDLDGYIIVAVGDFNMGAMENKGLNIFNTKYVLARPDTATDTDYQNIDRVVAHEYFHNWTGNRVTCRDWFQLSLKEGLTVFRDQEYGADMYSRPVQRIQEVRGLRAAQFPEDAGPMAHPVRPSSYIEINNFYTSTVYEKGAEVVRMIHTLLGREAFRRGMDLYFQRHDGQAVTTDDFVQAMEDASRVDLGQFRRWYHQAGTPRLQAHGEYSPEARRFRLVVRQSCPATPGQPDKLPLHIPFSVGLVAPDGSDLPVRLAGEATGEAGTRVLSLTEAEQTFEFVDVAVRPVPSLLRGFSAPVILEYPYSGEDLLHLMARDADAFNRWEAGQRLATDILIDHVGALRRGEAPRVPESYLDGLGRILVDAVRDPAFAAEALALPAEGFLAEQFDEVDPDAIHAARIGLRRAIAAALERELTQAYETFVTSGPYSPDAVSAGRRALRNACLSYLLEIDSSRPRVLAARQFDAADNMTDAMAALSGLANTDCPERAVALERFYAHWKDEALVVDKWFMVQATSRLPGTLAEVRRLITHPAFEPRNPNRVRSLVSAFCHGNHVRFHAADGSGYAFAAEQVVALDRINPQVAARLARCFDRWKKFDAGRQGHARAALERIRATDGLSNDVVEVVGRALA